MESEVTISFVGDLCPINKVQDLFTGDNSSMVYGDIIKEFNQSNYVVANLECPIFFNSLVLTVSVAFIFSFMVEPVMEGMFNTFCIFCFYSGVFNVLRYKKLIIN